MSSYGGYDWQSAEEARQRELTRLRGEWAAVSARRKALAKTASQAKRAGLTVSVPAELAIPAADRDTLAEAIATTTAALDQAEQQLASGWQDMYRTHSTVRPEQRGSTAAEEQAAARKPRDSDDDAAVLHELMADGGRLVDRVAVRCEQEHLTRVHAALDTLTRASTVATAQACLAELRASAQRAIAATKRAEQREQAAARIAALLAEVDEPRRTELARWVANVPDVAEQAVATTILAELDRQHRRAATKELAGTLAEIMTDLGFTLGHEFTTTLASTPERPAAVAALPGKADYGLTMSVDGSGRLRTELVRASTAPNDPEADIAAELLACQRLDEMIAKADVRGVVISRATRVRFGEPPPTVVDPPLLGDKHASEKPARTTTRATRHQRNQHRQRGAEHGGRA